MPAAFPDHLAARLEAAPERSRVPEGGGGDRGGRTPGAHQPARRTLTDLHKVVAAPLFPELWELPDAVYSTMTGAEPAATT